MARQFQVYDGAAPQSAQVGGKQVPLFAGIPQNGAAVDAAIGEAQELGVKIARLHDLGLQQRVTQERDRIRTELDVELQKAADVAWGSDESLFRADGSVNSDRYDAIVARFREEAERVDPGEFQLGENAVRFAGEQEALGEDIGLQAMRFTALRSLQNTRKAFNDNLELAVAREDWGAARGLIEDARGTLLNDTEAELGLLRLQRGRLRGLGAASRGAAVPPTLSVGGREYSGASAALALCEGAENMQSAQGRAVLTAEEVFGSEPTEPKPEGEQEPEVDDTAALTLSSTAVLPRESEAGAITLQPYQDPGRVDTFTLQPVEFENTIDAIVRQPASEFAQMVADLSYDNHIWSIPDRMGKPQFSCRPTAPRAVQRVAEEAQRTGEINPETCRSMVARLTMDAVAENPSVTTEQVMKLFDDAGIYEALGGGDAAAGQLRTRAIVEEMKQRTNAGTTTVNMETIKAMVAERVNRPGFFRGHAFYDVWRNSPRLRQGDKWEYPDNPEGQQAWSAVLRVYKEYRRDFNPSLPILAHSLSEQELHDAYVEEFEESAGDFVTWYRKEIYEDERKAAVEAATDYYMGAITEALRNNLSVDASGRATYGGYASEVSIAMRQLMTELPERPQDEVLTRLERTAEEGDATRSQELRLKAQRDYERLGRMREQHAANGARAAREAERQQRNEAKAEEREAARRLHVARSTPRQRAWVWDRQNAPDGEQPMCTIPVAEYERLRDELGYDGSQMVYIRVGSTKVLVAGTNDTERIQLNTPAVMKIQPRPSQRRNERWRTRGDLGYSYVFSSTEAR